ncbi:hypothetical protein EWM62_04865 [Mucilaginibacter terrigena]|uniref:Carboxypeptidase regulatory-like domain-containing protein n=1 Tax=Mucilaginibacter terrigena TaxID=2492395 RepID=A0A4Q5LPG0_9SPHI|nr:carboxypeptidase-like regulatory domain-containing protein [Mucilaginibacter terrigena]RYU91275.1 hypothetical protein EWM62_04865 [Mucilaginibacter terrigena]
MLFKKSYPKIYTLIILLLCLFFCNARGQDKTSATKKIISTVEDYRNLYPSEKLYIKLDRPNYTVTDTIWFKAWLFNAALYTPSKLSAKLYVELINDSSIVVKRFAIPLKMGLGYGQIALNEQLGEGRYTLRAYTNWMQNFGPGALFSKMLYIGKPLTAGNWLINEQHNITSTNNLNLAVTLTDINNLPVSYKDVELKLMEGNSTLFKSNYLTGDDGMLHSQVKLPANVQEKQLSLHITDKITKSTFSLPFYPGGTMQDIDLQFMPESGNMVAGLTNRVGFKAIGKDGLGVDVQGIINDSKGNQAGKFKSTRKGMGNFILLPQPGEAYTANYWVNGIKHVAQLPGVMPAGIILKVDNLANADSVFIHITATPGIAAANRQYVLLAQSAGGVYLGAALNLQKGFYNMAFAKSIFVSGIINFTLLDGTQPLAQRKIFIDHHDRMVLNIEPAHATWLANDSISVTLNALDAAANPVKGSFAVSVTDDALVKQDSLQENMESRLLLTSELKGNIEEPSWYFRGNDPLTAVALDNLMLTQGWTGFDNAIFAQIPATPKFLAEPDNALTGRVTGLFNNPFKNAKVSIFTTNKKYSIILIDTVTDANGRFKLSNLPLVDSIIYHIKATGKNGRELGAKFDLDVFKPAPITKSEGVMPMPWYAQHTDPAMIRLYSNPPQTLPDLNPDEVKGRLLKQVVIKGKKPIDPKTYIPMIRKVINEKTLLEAGNKNLRDLLAEKFNSLHIVGYYSPDKETEQYLIGHNILVDVQVDGQSMRQTYREQFVSTLRLFLYNIPASEIKNIRIYDGFYAVITIETRGGTGLNTMPTPGLIVYRPIPYNLAVQFYTPRYKLNNPALNNLRPTLYWHPDLVTDASGKVTLYFYAGNKPSTYTINIEGADMLGHFGAQTLKINIASKTTASK